MENLVANDSVVELDMCINVKAKKYWRTGVVNSMRQFLYI